MSLSSLEIYRGKKIAVTGHTGFKGSWLALWLKHLGAEVFGYSLPPPTQPSMFEMCGLATEINHYLGDIRDLASIRNYFVGVQPDMVIHLAAQPIVRQSYIDPLDTLSSNIMGTANVLEAVRAMNSRCALFVVSSDKCFENQEWTWGYRENDPMGGHDPYSMSKGATELVVSCWQRSYFGAEGFVSLASARAGNVIGGGDWAKDRIVPDCINAFSEGRDVALRNPAATRPWQHVLEPLGGYLLLGARLLGHDAPDYCSSWNFGPNSGDVQPVERIVRLIADRWGTGAHWTPARGPHPKEASLLSLNCDKAIQHLQWSPTWSLEKTVEKTVDWYKAGNANPDGMKEFTLRQIAEFSMDAAAANFGSSSL